MNCMLRKLILGKINDVVGAKKEGVEKARAQVALWTRRAKAVCQALESLSAKLEDSKLDPDELEAAVTDLKTLVENWK